MGTDNLALDVRELAVSYGKLRALTGVTLSLRPGEAIGLLGANGAGKTTLLNTLSGFLTPVAGAIHMFDQSIGGIAPHRIVRGGLAHVSQERNLFGDMSVIDNLRLGSLIRPPSHFKRNVERVYSFFPRLKERSQQAAATMSGGEQQMLAMGRAMMAEPKVILFDEPSAGLSPLFVTEIGKMMQTLRDEGEVSIVLVEQNMLLAAQVVDRFYILRDGAVVAEGDGSELKRDHMELAKNFYL